MQVTPEPCPAPHLTSLCRGTMTLAGGTFRSALPLPHTRGQTWQCQKSSAVGDRTTWHGTHQETVSPVPCTQTRGRGDAKKQHLLLPPTQTHLDHLINTHPCHKAADQLSLGTSLAHLGAGQPPRGLVVHVWAVKEGEAGGDTQGEGIPQAVCCSELTPLRKGIY